MLLARQPQEHDPKLSPVRTREDVRQLLAAVAARNATAHSDIWRRQQLFRRATLLLVLCFSTLQYYFLSVGVEILAIPTLTVFILPAGPG